jgi:hypothetical protein
MSEQEHDPHGAYDAPASEVPADPAAAARQAGGYSDPDQTLVEPAEGDRTTVAPTAQQAGGYSPPTQTTTGVETQTVATTPADLSHFDRPSAAEQRAADAEAAGYNAEPSEVYDPVAAHAGDGYPPPPDGAWGS